MVTIENLLELLALHGGKIVSTAGMDVQFINQAKASNRMFVDENLLGFVWEPDFYGGGKLFMIPETEEEVAWFDKWFPLNFELPEKLKNPSFLFDEDKLDNMFGICRGAKCQIENCKVCKNEMY